MYSTSFLVSVRNVAVGMRSLPNAAIDFLNQFSYDADHEVVQREAVADAAMLPAGDVADALVMEFDLESLDTLLQAVDGALVEEAQVDSMWDMERARRAMA